MSFMNDIQKIELALLIKLDEICRKHNLTYYLAYGTCIGAMRHKGFIPWDHDVDVLMPFEDARKLSDYQKDFEPDFYISSYINDSNNKTTKVLLYDKNHSCKIMQDGRNIETGKVCMDIYPFYNCPPTKIGLLFNIWRSHIYKILVGGIPKNHGKTAKIIGKTVLIFASMGNREKTIKRIERKLNYKGKSYEIADYYGLDITFMTAITYKKEWFGNPCELEFEGHKFFAPTDADRYLTKRYGDYMTPTSKKEIEKEVKIELVEEE